MQKLMRCGEFGAESGFWILAGMLGLSGAGDSDQETTGEVYVVGDGLY
ncbi:hypothetical protein [Nostoc sp. JL23]|nr:hypothetical protein [Nostoc sp. JL23]